MRASKKTYPAFCFGDSRKGFCHETVRSLARRPVQRLSRQLRSCGSPLALRRAGAAGLALPVTGALKGLPVTPVSAKVARQDNVNTLTIAMNGSPSDLDPHSVYDYRSAMPLRGPYESLIALEGGSTDKYVPVLAESWSPNDDKSAWTFTIRQGVTFHDGTPVDAEAVRKSFVRFLTMGLGPSGAFRRFITEPEQITAPDERPSSSTAANHSRCWRSTSPASTVR